MRENAFTHYIRDNTLYNRLLDAAGDDKLPVLDNKSFELLNKTYGKEKVRTHLADYIASERPIFPLKEITKDDMKQNFYKLQKFDTSTICIPKEEVEKEVFEKFKTIFESIADQSIYLGDTGTAHSIKLAMNLQIAMLALSLSEGITLTKKAGFDPEIFLKVLNSTYFKTGMSEGKAHKMINDSVKPTFTLANLKKDLDTINDAAESFDAELPMAKIARKIYADATDAGFGDIDYTGIISYIRKLSKE